MSVTLSLRVTRDKRKPGVKCQSVKEENIHHIIVKLRSQTLDVVGSSEYLDELEKAGDLKTQLEKLRQGFNLPKDLKTDKEKQERFYYMILVEILLYLELKSPLRSGIVRILKAAEKSSIIEELIAVSLKRRFKSLDSVSSVTSVTNTICGCFDNFPLGVEGVRACQVEIYNFIVENLKLCKDLLSTEGSPMEKSSVCECIHGLVRAGLHVCSLGLSAACQESIDYLHQLTLQMTACDQLPLDTRANCGLLTVATRSQDWLQMLKNQIISGGDDMASLCLLSGFIGSLSAEEFSVTVGNEFEVGKKTALQLIFDSIMDIHRRNPLQPTLTLSIARTLVSLSRVLLSSGSQVNYMLPRLLDYVWEHLEHVMDSVKHLASTLLHNVAKLHSPDVDVHGAILTAIKRLPVWGRARHTALSTMVGKVSVYQLLDGSQDIISLYQHLDQELISSHAVNAFQELMKHHYQEIKDKEEWKELWVKPLLLHLDKNPSVPLQQVLSKAVLVCPDTVEYVLCLPKDAVSLRSILLCLHQALKLGRLAAPYQDSNKWRGLVDYSLLHMAIQHVEQQTRLSCFSLIVEAPKTTEAFTTNELKLIVEYISHNLNFESPALRQRNIALLVKFVSRLYESKQALMRQHSDSQAQLLNEYSECEANVEASCVESLFPGATYSRRVTALHVLTALRASSTSATPPSTATLTSTLLTCLSDSYEDVKAIAMRLLVNTPGLLQDFKVPKNVVTILGRSLEQAGGVKPPECLSAAYLLATLAQVPFSQASLTAVTNKYSCCAHLMDLHDIEHETVYCCLLIVTDFLTQQLSVAQVSLLRAASSGPLYGLLFTAKLLLSQINLRDCRSESWRQLIARLVELSFSCSQAVASVVNNDSPEGHFPMDFDFDPGDYCGGEEEEVEGVTSQMVLLCSWRTVKEVSLLLGFLVEEVNIALSPQDEGLLCSDDLLKIGDHLTTLLAETKHRGAFEQAYVGFCKLVSCLWRLPSGPLQQLPQRWLEDTMQEICNNNENLCATRRSAGIPFMIQALICTLVEVEGVAAIEPWVCRLLDLAESASVPPTTHTHALNILRALFRNTQLGEAVSIFVERAIIITITAFSAPSWMERNSATLLLSALITRVFGVPRSKSQDHLSWKNKMTGRIFFQRYPKLFDFFQKQLRKASKLNDKDLHSRKQPCHRKEYLIEKLGEIRRTKIINLHPSLYPVLLILGRLYPSSLEGTDSNVQLTQYIPDIVVCAGSNIYKTRTLVATAMVPLMTVSHLDPLMTNIIEPFVNSNFRHGLLLQVAYFLKQSDPKVDQQVFKNKAESWIANIINLCASDPLPSDKYSYVKFHYLEFEAMYQVLIIFSEKYFEFISIELWDYVIVVTKELLKSNGITGRGLGSCLVRPRINELLLKLAVVMGGDDLESVCCEMLRDSMYEVKNTVYDFITCLNSDDSCSERFDVFLKSLEPQARSKCKCLIFEGFDLSEVFAQTVLDMLFSYKGHSYHSEDKAQILMVLKTWRRAFERVLEARNVYPDLDHVFFLVNLCKHSHDVVALHAVYCLTEFMCLKEFLWEEDDLTAVCELLVELNNLENSEIFNFATYDLLSRQFDTLQKSTKPLNRLVLYKTYIELSAAHQWPSAAQRVIEAELNSCVTVSLLCAFTLGKVVPQAADQAQIVSRVFDREEVNDAYEEYMLSKICGQKLRELCECDKNLLTKTLSPELREWLTSHTDLAGDSVAQFIALAKLKALQLNPDDPCQFLSPGYQNLRLNSLKLKNIL